MRQKLRADIRDIRALIKGSFTRLENAHWAGLTQNWIIFRTSNFVLIDLLILLAYVEGWGTATQVNTSHTAKIRQYPAINTNSILRHCKCYFYNIILLFDTVVTRKQTFKYKKYWIQQCRHLATLACITKAWMLPGQHARHSSTVGNFTIALSEWMFCCIHMETFHTVCLLHNLHLNGTLYLCGDKNAAF